MGEIVFRKLRALFPDFLHCEKRHGLRLPLIGGTDFFRDREFSEHPKEVHNREVLTGEARKSVRDEKYVVTRKGHLNRTKTIKDCLTSAARS